LFKNGNVQGVFNVANCSGRSWYMLKRCEKWETCIWECRCK